MTAWLNCLVCQTWYLPILEWWYWDVKRDANQKKHKVWHQKLPRRRQYSTYPRMIALLMLVVVLPMNQVLVHMNNSNMYCPCHQHTFLERTTALVSCLMLCTTIVLKIALQLKKYSNKHTYSHCQFKIHHLSIALTNVRNNLPSRMSQFMVPLTLTLMKKLKQLGLKFLFAVSSFWSKIPSNKSLNPSKRFCEGKLQHWSPVWCDKRHWLWQHLAAPKAPDTNLGWWIQQAGVLLWHNIQWWVHVCRHPQTMSWGVGLSWQTGCCSQTRWQGTRADPVKQLIKPVDNM